MNEINSQNILLIGFVVAFIILFSYYLAKSEGFDAESYLYDISSAKSNGSATIKRAEDLNMIGRNPNELSYEDTIKSVGGGYVEFFTPSEPDSNVYNVSICSPDRFSLEGPSGLIFNITELNNVFKYSHLNDKVFTIRIPAGNYDGESLAKEVGALLNKADPGWWIVWDGEKRRFSIGAFEFKYSRYAHPHSIYKTMGLEIPEVFGLTAGTTDWLDNETGSTILNI